jgi:hypothetical protein
MALHPAVGTDGTFCFRFKICDKMLPAEVQAGVRLGDNRMVPAPAAPHRCFPDQNWMTKGV